MLTGTLMWMAARAAAARALGVSGIAGWLGTRARQWLSGAPGIALAVAAAACVVLIGLWWFRADGAASAAAARDAVWKERLAVTRAKDLAAQRARDRAAADAAAAERRHLEAARDAALEQAAEVERRLADAERALGDPVIFPRDLVRSLRK